MQNKFTFLKEYQDIQQLTSSKILLIGDSCIDEYHYGSFDRISPEAPVPILTLERVTQIEGMSANVKRNLESFDLNVTFVTNDPSKIIKRRYIDERYRQMLFREDQESSVPYVDLSSIDIMSHDAIVISDYCKGSINYEYIYHLCKSFGRPIFVDTKSPNLSPFINSILKINESEYKKAHNKSTDSELIVTLGKKGAQWGSIKFPAPEVDVFDVTGAGDVFLAALTFFTLMYGNLIDSIPRAVKAASISVQHGGIYSLTKNDIESIK